MPPSGNQLEGRHFHFGLSSRQRKGEIEMSARRRRQPTTTTAPTTPTIIERVPALLYTRRQASQMLNVSISTLLRLEASNQLRGVRLTKGKASAMVYYPAADLISLANGGGR
jgi:hypothetical protein